MKLENKTQKRQRAKKLIRQYQLSQQLAFAVVNNECSLHEAIVRSKEEVEYDQLQRMHDLSVRELDSLRKSEQTLTDILVQKNTKSHIDETDAQPNVAVGFSGLFWRHDEEGFRGEIINATRYDLELLTQTGSLTLPKLHIKACTRDEMVPVQEGDNDVEPVLRVEDRFRISNKQLYRFLLQETSIRVSLLGGLVFEGVLQRVGRYECTMLCGEDNEVILMRHAFALVEEVS